MTIVGDAPWNAALYCTLGPLTGVRANEAPEKRAAKVTVRGYISVSDARGVSRSVDARRWFRGRAAI